MVREFNLINEKGQTFSLMDIKNYCLLTEPSGLGYNYSSEYEQIENSFISNVRKIEQGQINGIVNFANYDNYTKLVDFIEGSETLKFQYIIPQKEKTLEFYKDIQIQGLSKTQIQTTGVLSETITFDCLSLWYKENNVVYLGDETENEIRWDFEWDSRFTDYENRNLVFENKGHVEAPFLLEMNGYVLNPKVQVYVNNEKIYELALNIAVEENEKLMYSTKDNDLFLYLIHADNSVENLFNYLDLNNINFFKLPKGVSEVRIRGENEILNTRLTIFEEYVAV